MELLADSKRASEPLKQPLSQKLSNEKKSQSVTSPRKGCNRQVRNAFLTYSRLGLHRIREDKQRRTRISQCAANREEERILVAANETLRLLTCFGRRDCVQTIRTLWMEENGTFPHAPSVSAYAAREGKNLRTVFRELALVRLCWEKLMEMP